MGQVHGHERSGQGHCRLPDVAKFNSFGVSLRLDVPPDAPGLGLPLLSTIVVAARYGGHVPRGARSTVVFASTDHGDAARRRLDPVTPPNLDPVHGQLQLVQPAHLYLIITSMGRRFP